ncbi:unnamed protein product [Periconia digitata]|uniref:Uncharacterized protein n=1 Tax=Periconia digitata TaxID=1303443 RepID=A0A9W4ULV4_9PLEO|nr:unnamed protein product [Periconia digitata]
MQFRVFLLFLLTSLVAASPLWERSPKKGKGKTTTKANTTKADKTTTIKTTSAAPTTTSKAVETTSSSSKVVTSSSSSSSSKISSSTVVSITSSSSSASSSKPSSSSSSSSSASSSKSSSASSSSSTVSSSSAISSSSASSSASSAVVTGSASSSATKSGSSSSSGITSAASSSNTASSSGSITSSSSISGSSSSLSSSGSRNSTISATSSGVSSSASASASSTKFICGVGCGKNGCALKPSGTAKTSSKPKSTKRAELERRTLKDVSTSQADKYVIDTITDFGSTKGLDYTFNNDFAVSRHGSFANKPFPDFVTGLEGCTGVAVVSEKGYWISHFMEIAYQPEEKAKYENLQKAVKNGNTKYTRPETLNDLFGEGTNPQIYVMRPRDGHTNELLYATQTQFLMGEIQQGILKGLTPKTHEYKKPKDENELNTSFESTARGKMLIEYDNNQKVGDQTASPQQAIARVFMENKIYKQEWAAKENQLEGAKDADKPVEAPAHKPTCLTDAANTLTEADVTAAFDSVFKKALDISSPISQTGKSGEVSVQFNIKKSADQTGCTASAGKAIMRTQAKRIMLEVSRQCPKAGSSTEFMGVKPDVHSTPLGCLDVEIFRV